MHVSITMLLWIVGMLMLNACGNDGQKNHSLQIYIFDRQAISVFDNTYDSMWNVMQEVPLSASVYTITENLIVDYAWNIQTLHVINEWAENDQEPPELFMVNDGVFLVVFDDRRISAGRIMRVGSAQMVKYPVMAIRSDTYQNPLPGSRYNALWSFSFHPISTIAYEQQAEFPAHDPAMTQPIHDYLEAIGKLK